LHAGEEYLTNAAGEALPDAGELGDAPPSPENISEEFPSERREDADDAGLEGGALLQG